MTDEEIKRAAQYAFYVYKALVSTGRWERLEREWKEKREREKRVKKVAKTRRRKFGLGE